MSEFCFEKVKQSTKSWKQSSSKHVAEKRYYSSYCPWQKIVEKISLNKLLNKVQSMCRMSETTTIQIEQKSELSFNYTRCAVAFITNNENNMLKLADNDRRSSIRPHMVCIIFNRQNCNSIKWIKLYLIIVMQFIFIHTFQSTSHWPHAKR